MNHSKRLFSYGSASMVPVNNEAKKVYLPVQKTETKQVQNAQPVVSQSHSGKKLGIPGTSQVYYTSSERASMNAKQRLDRNSQLDRQLGVELMQFDDSGMCY